MVKIKLRSIEITSKTTDVAGNSDTSMPLPLNGSFMRVKSSLVPEENFEVIEISGNVSSI